MSKINDFLTEAGVFFLATVDGDQPKLRPLGAHMELDGKVLFGVGDFKDVYRQMVANPKVDSSTVRQWSRSAVEARVPSTRLVFLPNGGAKATFLEPVATPTM